MDGRGRLAQSLTWIARLRARPPNNLLRAFVIDDLKRASRPLARHLLRRGRGWFLALLCLHVPRGVGMAAVVLLILSSIAYGTVEGGHVPTIVNAFKEARDQAANAAGFRIKSVALSGNVHVSREEVLAVAGITGTKAPDLAEVKGHVGRIKAHTNLPIAVGFGVKNEAQVSAIASVAEGVVVGSALVASIAQSLDDKGKATRTTKLQVLGLVVRLAAALRHPAEAVAL